MRKLVLLLVVFLMVGLAASADERIAVLDFQVESSNEKFQHLGKGFAEFVSVELSRAEEITLVDRKRRNAVMEEISFGMSGLADESTAKEVGKLLSADYLISGMIIDMAGMLVVTCELVEVETGEVVVHEKADGGLSDYERITEKLAGAVVQGLDLTGREAVRMVKEKKTEEEQAPEKKPSKEEAEEVLTTFSEAVDAYDEGKTSEAKEKLERAAAIDRDNRAVRFYLDKLYVSTSKFKVVPAAYFTQSNPASLAFLSQDSLGINIGAGSTIFFHEKWPDDPEHDNFSSLYELENTYGPEGNERYAVSEGDGRLFVRYAWPVGQRMGMSVEAFYSFSQHGTQKYEDISDTMVMHSLTGGILSFGWTPLPWIGLGISATGGHNLIYLTYQKEGTDETFHQTPSTAPLVAATAGLILKNRPGTLIFSWYEGVSSFESYEIDLETQYKGDKIRYPLYTDATLTYGFNRKRTYLILKFIEDWFMMSEGSLYTEITPAAEHWFTEAFSVRGGPVLFTNYDDLQLGGMLGNTLILNEKWEINFSTTLRYRGSRVTSQETIPEVVFNVGLNRLGLWKER
jgi:TolB-like protein